jgi:hypothetical protein
MSMEPKNYGRNLKGELITDEMIEKISRKAEEGWDVEELLTWREVDLKPEPTQGDHDQASPTRLPGQRPSK